MQDFIARRPGLLVCASDFHQTEQEQSTCAQTVAWAVEENCNPIIAKHHGIDALRRLNVQEGLIVHQA